MKKSFLLVMAALSIVSCGPKDSAVVNVEVPGAAGKEIVLSKLQVNQIKVVDTLKLDSKGAVKYNVSVAEDMPDFYYLSYNRKRLQLLWKIAW